ncbi:MAG: TRAP transporter small permease, partial [Candidatus Atribacteria bacterium]|nr:TRAP transporter small permease [Candidatus Atribacteria bacterium]
MKNNIIAIIDFILDKIVPLLMLILITFIIIITTSDIFSRLFFSRSLIGAIDMSKYLFIWLVFIGISYGIKIDEHFKITEIVDKFPDKLQMIIKKIITILILVFFSVVLYSSVR